MSMKPVTEEIRSELKFRLFNSEHGCEKSSDKTKSYMNFFSKSMHGDNNFKVKNNKNQDIIAKIYQNKKTSKYHLLKYNAVKSESSDILLEVLMNNKVPAKKIAKGKNSGYYFIYDNQGIISVIAENIKICELTLPDSRMDPTLFVYEIEYNRLILFVAGGFVIKSSNISTPSESIAVFFLNFKDSSKILTNEPLIYIKMKYPRMHPIMLLHKNENEQMLILLGGNVQTKFKDDKRAKSIKEKKKSTPQFLNEANMMCETIRIKKVKDAIYESNAENVPIISTDDCLCLIINGAEDIQAQNHKIRHNLGEAGILQIKDRKKHKTYYIIGLGKHHQEIWYIDMFDFIEHKVYIYQTQSFLKRNKNRVMCNSMMVKVGDDIYYLDDDETTMYKKLSMKKIRNNNNGNYFNSCKIF